jgi:hypothetical protein
VHRHIQTVEGALQARRTARSDHLSLSRRQRAPGLRQAHQRVERAAAETEWQATFGGIDDGDVDVDQVVLDEIRWLRAHVAWLRGRVQVLDPAALVWSVEREVTKRSGNHPGVDTTHAARVNTWIVLYGETQDQLLTACAIAHRMGIEARQVALAERLGDAVADVLDAVLNDLGLTQHQWTAAGTVVPAQLRALADSIGAGHAN